MAARYGAGRVRGLEYQKGLSIMTSRAVVARGWPWMVLVAVALIVIAGASTANSWASGDGSGLGVDCRQLLPNGGVWSGFDVEDDELRVKGQVIARAAETDRLAAQRNTEMKIAYSATGDGLVNLVAHGPSGQTQDPLWNTTVSNASTAIPNSDDFHSGWSFPSAGCWTVTVQRGEGMVQLAVPVAD